MKNLKRFVKLAFLLPLILLFCFIRAGAFCWNKSILRADVERAIDCGLVETIQIKSAKGRFMCYAALCQSRIKLLKKILKNTLLLPADIAQYSSYGHVPSNSYETEALCEISADLQYEEVWKSAVNDLIRAYKSMESDYLFIVRL